MIDWSLIIAIIAIVISIVSLFWNWWHSESLFRRTAHPPVAWHLPKVTKKDSDTIITTSIRNHGPKEITSVFLSAYLCRGFKVRPWCKIERINELPIGEELIITITEELEKDISERFSGLFYDNGWRYKGREKKYKILFVLEYLPVIAETTHLCRKAYYIIKPIIKNSRIESWELKSIPERQGWLPWF
jgi:hypothetical protein